MEILGKYKMVGPYKIHYDVCGEGQPIVLLPTAGASAPEYHEVMEYLAGQGLQAIAVEPPAHGLSYPNLKDLSIPETADEYVDFVWDFTQELKLKKPVFIGCAMSGSAVLLLAAKYGNAIAGVVAAEGNSKFEVGLECKFHNRPCVNTADYKEVFTPMLCSAAAITGAEKLNQIIWHNSRNCAAEASKADLAIYNTWDVSDKLSQIPCPVLHLYGEDDFTVLESSKKEILEKIPNVKAQVLERAGHFSALEQPVAFAKAVAEFVKASCQGLS